jgi:hypothetical protein
VVVRPLLIEEQVSGSGEADLPIFPPIIITVVLCGVVEGRSWRQDRRQRLCPQFPRARRHFNMAQWCAGRDARQPCELARARATGSWSRQKIQVKNKIVT